MPDMAWGSEKGEWLGFRHLIAENFLDYLNLQQNQISCLLPPSKIKFPVSLSTGRSQVPIVRHLPEAGCPAASIFIEFP